MTMNLPLDMLAFVVDGPGKASLRRIPVPRPAHGEVLLEVHACGVCRTDLHLLDGELPRPKRPVVPGHEIVGTVVASGAGADRYAPGTRVGVPWLGGTCGTCRYCRSDRENLCDAARFTGYTHDGGFAEFTAADQRYCFPLPASYGDVEAAPLLCAGLIGYRSYRLCGESCATLGIYGFGAAGHIVAQLAVHQGKRVFAFSRAGDTASREFALRLGATWAGDSTALPPEPLDAAILFAPVGALVPAALRAVAKGGVVVCGGIHMSDIPSFPYALLWEERTVRSVANLERRDGDEFLALAPRVPVRTTVVPFDLEDAAAALARLRDGRLEGAAVLRMPRHRG
jgi:propanol-preferring alcohol dehydrogenase